MGMQDANCRENKVLGCSPVVRVSKKKPLVRKPAALHGGAVDDAVVQLMRLQLTTAATSSFSFQRIHQR